MEAIIPCWNCQTDTKVVDFRCSICNKIQNIRKTNPYEIFNLKQCYLIDNEELELKYYDLQNIFHPDKFINSAEKEKEISAYESSNINNAYNLLLNNVDRIKILLKLKGYNTNSNSEKSFTDKNLLEEIMELQNRCMSVENENEKVKIKTEIVEKIRIIESEINQNFEKKKFFEIKNLSVKLSYLEKIKKNLN
jgi:molecular chaperone HscB